MEKLEARIKEKDFTNDILFKELMLRYKNLCKEIIQRCVPDLDIQEIEMVQSEKEISYGLDTRRIRIDAFASDGKRKYAIEMMTYKIDYIEKYSRYRQSMLDMAIEIGTSPKELTDTVVILFCTYDPLGFGKAKYDIKSFIDEEEKPLYNDGRRIVIVTPKGIENASDEIKPIVGLLGKSPSQDAFTAEIQNAIKELKIDPEVRRVLMDQDVKMQAIRDLATEEALAEGRAKGLKEGLEEGRAKGLKEGRVEGLAEGRSEMQKQAIANLQKSLNISEAEARKLLNF